MKVSSIKHLSSPKRPEEQGDVFLSSTEHLKTFMLWLNPEFRKEIHNIREEFKVDLNKSNDEKYIVSIIKNNDGLSNQIKKLRKKFDLSKRWEDFLMEYVVTDHTSPWYDIEGLRLEIVEDEQGEKEYSLQLTKETTLNEIIAAWPLIEKALNRKKRIEKPWKKFWRDYKIYELTQNGKTISEIYRYIIEKYGDDLDYGNIKKILSNFKKKIGIKPSPIIKKLRTK